MEAVYNFILAGVSLDGERQVLLYEAHVRRRPTSFGRFLDGTELGFVPRKILSQRAPDALGVSRANNHAAQQLALSAVRENIDKIQSELFQIVVNHHQVAVLPLQFLLICLDLHLPRRGLLLVHLVSLPE
jgi:hypothetical protein